VVNGTSLQLSEITLFQKKEGLRFQKKGEAPLARKGSELWKAGSFQRRGNHLSGWRKPAEKAV